MSNPKNKITTEEIKIMKEDIKKIFQAICHYDKIRVINFQKGEIYKAL